MKRSISLILATLLAGSAALALASCGEEYKAEINWDVDLTKPITIKAIYPETGISAFGRDPSAQIIQEKTGYTVEYAEFSAGNADNEVNNYLSTQKDYHIMKLTAAQYDPYVAGGTFLDLTELLQKTESGKKLYELIDLMDYGWESVTYIDEEGKSHIYGIPDFGYVMMQDEGMVWNMKHLEAIGYDHIPETMAELDDAFTKLQAKYGAEASNYHAFGIPGSNSSNITQIMSAFEVGFEFSVNEDGKIQQYVYDEGVDGYVTYMNELRKKGVISSNWQNGSSDGVCGNFASELHSCVYLPYWWVTPLINSVVAKGQLAKGAGVTNDYDTVKSELIGWNLRIKGDGTAGTAVQEKAKYRGGDAGVSYYTVIPKYMAENAVYLIDFLGKKLEYFADFYGGREGIDWNKIDPPAGANAYYEADDYSFQQYEDYEEMIIYISPYSYQFQGETVTGGGFWVQLTDNYIEYIADNSQYCNGTNSVVAKSLFHMRETGFDAWQVTCPMDDTIIENPMTMAPTFESWGPVNILSRTVAKRGIASAIDAEDPIAAINLTRNSMKSRNVKKNGITYYYWSDDISNEMTEWYNRVKLGQE